MLAGVINFTGQGQLKKSAQDSVKTQVLSASHGPNSIVRTIRKDRKGNIWIASWEGVFKYDGKSFTNITSKVSSARFFSVLEDRKGNFWFTTIGSGVYYYDGKSFQNFTVRDGLANDRVGNIYEDKIGKIWFGTEGGVSRYNGKSFQNFKMKEIPSATAADSVYVGTNPVHKETDSVHISAYQHPLPEASWIHNDVNAIMEDRTGKFWFGTRGHAFVYDGKTFTTITNKEGKPFTNVRSIIKDKKGNIWLGGADGLWCYNGSIFTRFAQNFVGYIYEDKKGNIWTSSEKSNRQSWTLSKYEGKSLSDKKPAVTTIANKPIIFGILEDDIGHIWFGALNGVYRYDGKTITDFKSTASGQ
ncbi:histidine kinase [Flavobacterium pectinovorum]|nr:histidine kinase [Flavobacterium pectinovorum]